MDGPCRRRLIVLVALGLVAVLAGVSVTLLAIDEDPATRIPSKKLERAAQALEPNGLWYEPRTDQ
jgi:hypothetical protein